MAIRTRLLSLLVLLLALTAVVTAQKRGRSQDTPVTSTLHDTGDIALSTNHDLQSDGAGPYTTFVGSKDTVESIIQTASTCCQDWELDLDKSRTRSLLIDLREPVAPNVGAGSPFDWAYVPGRILVRCHLVVATSFPGMALGEVLECPMVVSFPVPGSNSSYWNFAFNSAGDPQTDSARVECLNIDGAGKCNDWAVTPAGVHDNVAKSAGRLEKVYFKGNTSPEIVGYYLMSFSFRVTNP